MKISMRAVSSILLAGLFLLSFTAFAAKDKTDKDKTDKDKSDKDKTEKVDRNNPFNDLNRQMKSLEERINREKGADRMKELSAEAQKIAAQKKELHDKLAKDLKAKKDAAATDADKEKVQAEIEQLEAYYDPVAAAAKKKKEEEAKKPEKKDDKKTK